MAATAGPALSEEAASAEVSVVSAEEWAVVSAEAAQAVGGRR